MQQNEQKTDEVFDATVETENATPPTQNEQVDLDEARLRAEHQNMITANLVDDIISQKKKSFRRTVIFSVSSVVILLILAIVFFVYLRWYGAGAGVAIIAFAVAQIWLHFFKKWDYGKNESDDFLDYADDIDSQPIDPKQPDTNSKNQDNLANK